MDRILQLLTTLRAVPGVSRATVIDTIMLAGMRRGSPFRHTGPDSDAGEMIPVSSQFFEVTGLRAIDGRLPTDAEIDAGAPVGVVSERVAREYWPGQSPLGQTLSSKRATVSVIGVVRDSRFQGLDQPSAGEIYVPAVLGVWTASAPTYLVRATIPEETVLRGLIEAIQRDGPAASIRRAQDVETALAYTIQRRRFQASLFGLMAAAGLLVAAAGILGVTAASTARRTREMGIRLALGSTRDGLIRLLLREQLWPVMLGMAAGGVVAAWVVRYARTSLYELSAYDPSVWVAAIVTVLIVAVIGTLVPASRVVRIDPVQALRAE
jgi:ABC-type antimicrobial peptide transport system permease subunit